MSDPTQPADPAGQPAVDDAADRHTDDTLAAAADLMPRVAPAPEGTVTEEDSPVSGNAMGGVAAPNALDIPDGE